MHSRTEPARTLRTHDARQADRRTGADTTAAEDDGAAGVPTLRLAAAHRRRAPDPRPAPTPALPTLGDLAAGLPIEIGVDTEFAGARTLTVQAACRIASDTVAVQLYRAACVPEPPARFDLGEHLPPGEGVYGRFFARAALRPVLPLSSALSPVRLLQDLLGLDGVTALPLGAGRKLLEQSAADDAPPGCGWDAATRRWSPRRSASSSSATS
jgi:hypothetical protein